MKVGLIGGGTMGEAIIAALLRDKVATASDIRVGEKVESRLDYLKGTYGVGGSSHSSDATAGADYLLLAVKPQDYDTTAGELDGSVGTRTTVVSIMAGIPIARLTAALSTERVVRAMPNTPAQIGEGMTVWTATPEVSEEAREGVRRIFTALGKEAFVPEEKYLDMATAVSGSGPAYVFLFIEALIDAGVHIGLSRDLATTLALQTVLGSAAYADRAGKHPAELRAMVTSPGGTTADALRALEAGAFRADILDAVIAAFEKAKSLGGGDKK